MKFGFKPTVRRDEMFPITEDEAVFQIGQKAEILGHKLCCLSGVVDRACCIEVLVCVECSKDTMLTRDK